MDLNRLILRAFKGRGFTVTSEACRALSAVLSDVVNPEESIDAILQEIREGVEKRESEFITHKSLNII